MRPVLPRAPVDGHIVTTAYQIHSPCPRSFGHFNLLMSGRRSQALLRQVTRLRPKRSSRPSAIITMAQVITLQTANPAAIGKTVPSNDLPTRPPAKAPIAVLSEPITQDSIPELGSVR